MCNYEAITFNKYYDIIKNSESDKVESFESDVLSNIGRAQFIIGLNEGNKIEASRANLQVRIFKLKGFYFLVRFLNYPDGLHERIYKCDQRDGLKECLIDIYQRYITQ